MMETKVKQDVLYASDSHGVYIPQYFAESCDRSKFRYISEEQYEILGKGPDHEFYWEVWDEVLNNAETICGGVLHQDGDLWVVWPQLAINAVNEYCQDSLEYEESHRDAGDAYAHMPAESWCTEKDQDLARQIDHWNIDTKNLDPEELSDIALDIFQMEPGHIFSNIESQWICIDSYHVQEVEIDLSHLGIDPLTMDLIRESCDAYISGTDLAYMTSGCVWYAVIDPKEYQEAINQYAIDKES